MAEKSIIDEMKEVYGSLFPDPKKPKKQLTLEEITKTLRNHEKRIRALEKQLDQLEAKGFLK